MLILENSAGAGGNIGWSLEDLGALFARSVAPRVKVCVDTQHSYAAGYDLATAEGLELAISEFEGEVGLDRLVAVHADDSKVELGSGRDRHENIGEATSASTASAHPPPPRLRRCAVPARRPWLRRTKGPDQKNVEILKQLLPQE